MASLGQSVNLGVVVSLIIHIVFNKKASRLLYQHVYHFLKLNLPRFANLPGMPQAYVFACVECI